MANRLEVGELEEPRELAQTDIRAMDDLSQETFESFSDEVQTSCSFSSPGGRLPSPQVSGGKPERGEPTARLECQDKQSELSEKRFSQKRINYLKGKGTNSGGYQPDTCPQTEITPVSDEQMHALQTFCTVKVNLMHHRATSKGKKSSRHKKLQLRSDAEASEMDAINCTVPDELVNRIHLKNVMATLKQAATVRQHVPSRCPDCNRKRAELAQSAFLKRKKTLLESLLLQEKIDEHLHTKDFLTFIGEVHRGLPRLSDDPGMIWKRLNEKSQKRESGFERSDPEQMM
ncbi:hypothetical protein D623_10033357 [Myotis brandtii]|uniref:Uncharacterized protein n=1 Tax=Myotis brandtii TaxID=109478 RepID=S7MQ34_MYOBR|nr:PREDICTED: uncharacterized protein C8orf48 homolog [Myotis brandtii]EPQ06394.1 hypothetical protein D623_10033357 [Myotis brandtii]